MNIEDMGAVHACTSCQVCAAVCPKGAITIGLDGDGFYRPAIDNDTCVDCGICKKVCYKYADVEPYDIRREGQTVHYAARANDREVVENTTSGGIADLLCRKLIAGGYTCVGVAYDYDRDIAVGQTASTEEEARAFRGSKYIQSYSYPAFRRILAKDREGKYAVFGTPCQIFALDRYLKLRHRRDDFVLVDIYCHGCPSMNVWTKYVAGIRRKKGVGRFDRVDFRSKVRGWGNFYVVVVVVDGEPVWVSPRTNDRFYTLFFSDAVLNDACHDCRLRSTLDACDIRLGDFWGKQYDLDSRGVSVVSLASPRGREVFASLGADIRCREHSPEDFLPYQSWGRSYRVDTALRKRLLEALADKDTPLDEAVDIYRKSVPWKRRLKQLAKNLALLMPAGTVSVVRRMYH